MSREIIIFVTAPNSDEASRIANALVTKQLAACVNIVPSIESIYQWEGALKHDNEALMIIKTTNDRYAEVERSVRELHTYSTPEVIAVEIERGSEEYLKWLRQSVLEVPHSGEDHR